MLITENVLRKIIAEEYEKLVDESVGISGKDINQLLPLLKTAAGDEEQIKAILRPHVEALKANAGQAYKLQNTARIYDKDNNIVPFIKQFFEENGIAAKSTTGYVRSSSEKEAPEGGYAAPWEHGKGIGIKRR